MKAARPAAPAAQCWTFEQVESRFIEWADTLKRLPDREHAWIYSAGTFWPLSRRDQGEEFANAVARGGRYEDMPEPFVPASRAAIGRFWETNEWFAMIPNPRDRKIVAAVAMSLTRRHKLVSWGWVKRATGIHLHYTTLKRAYQTAIQRVQGGLNSHGG